MVPGDGTGCFGWSRHCNHAAAVPAVRRVLGAFGSVPRQSGGHSSRMQILVRTVHTVQQTVEISQLQFWGWLSTRLLLCSDRCPAENCGVPQLQCLFASSSSWTRLLCPLVQRLGSRNAWFDDRHMLYIIQGGFWKIFYVFYMKGSILVLQHIVDHGSGMFHAG